MKERAFRLFLIVIIALLLLIIVVGMADGATPPPDLPPAPEGCTLAYYQEGTGIIGGWGGWVTDPPYQLCGIAIKTGETWHSLFQEDCSNLSSNGQTNCMKRFDDGTMLQTRSMTSESGVRIEGFDTSTPLFNGGAYYIPIPDPAGDPLPPPLGLHRLFVPDVHRFDWVIGPPPVPGE